MDLWSVVFTQEFIIEFLRATVRMATPILIACLGQIFTQRSGILNLGVEGIMMMGALASFVGALLINDFAGLLFAVLVGGTLGLFISVMMVNFSLPQHVVGIGFWMFGVNMASFLARIIWGFKPPTAITGLPITPIPILDKIPIIGEALFSHDIFLYFTFFVLVPLCWLVIHRTRWGLVITATGENPKAADTMGVNVYRVRSLCIILGGIMASLGGAYLTLAYVKMFSDGMTAGRGWIAIALTFFSQWDPAKALIGALLFGASYSFYFRAQTLAIPIPYRFLLMVPYVMTIVAMVIIYTRKRVVAPAALATPYRRGST